jgi:CheY-like chemotaxis protein
MKSPATILFVEDEHSDRLLFAKAFKKSGLEANAKFVESGFELKEYLLGEGKFSNRRVHPFPDVVVTDFRMPGFDGLQVLEWMKDSEAFQDIPVVLFSAVMTEKDFRRARELGADTYLTKPEGLREIADLFKISFEPFLGKETQQKV